MLFWCTASLLALASTMVHGAPLASLASNHSSNTLFERGLNGSPCSLKRLCILKLHEMLNSQRNDGGYSVYEGFSFEEHRRNPQWPEMSKDYAKSQAMFTEAIWSTYPSMKRHLEIVYHLILEPGFYTSTGQPIDPKTDGAEINVLEAETARMLLILETIARESKDEDQIYGLTVKLNILVRIWLDFFRGAEYISPERKNAYISLERRCNGVQFVFYYEKESWAYEQVGEADVQKEAAKYLKPGNYRYNDWDYTSLEKLDKEMQSMVKRTGQFSPSDEDLHLDELRVPHPDQLFGSDRYARAQEIFSTLYHKHASVVEKGEFSPVPVLTPSEVDTYDPDTRRIGPGRIGVIGAEYARNCALGEIRKNKHYPPDPVAEVRSLLARANLLITWIKAIKGRKFIGFSEETQRHLSMPNLRKTFDLLKMAWSACDFKCKGLGLDAGVDWVLAHSQPNSHSQPNYIHYSLDLGELRNRGLYGYELATTHDRCEHCLNQP